MHRGLLETCTDIKCEISNSVLYRSDFSCRWNKCRLCFVSLPPVAEQKWIPWRSGQPNSQNEQCVVVQNGEFSDKGCTERRRFVCTIGKQQRHLHCLFYGVTLCSINQITIYSTFFIFYIYFLHLFFTFIFYIYVLHLCFTFMFYIYFLHLFFTFIFYIYFLHLFFTFIFYIYFLHLFFNKMPAFHFSGSYWFCYTKPPNFDAFQVILYATNVMRMQTCAMSFVWSHAGEDTYY